MRSKIALDRYNDFNSLQRQFQVRADAEAAVNYIHEEGIGAIALLDTSARPFYIPLIHEWNQRFDRAIDPRPPIYFLSPRGFRSKEVSPGFESTVATAAIFDRRPYEPPFRKRKAREIKRDFPAEYPELYSRREEPLLLIDTCAHSGRSAIYTTAMLRELGFSDVRFMASYSELTGENVKHLQQVTLNDEIPYGGCYPWGQDYMTSQTYRSARPQKERRKKQRAVSAALRHSLREVALRPTHELAAELEVELARLQQEDVQEAGGEPTTH
ncbi:MAG TPA: hypothetical protein VLF62_06680 [Candidatus Saccharimonadales bacterium]|nr:hypothetical protein [Candidatus Saccharimonadales bacterium]